MIGGAGSGRLQHYGRLGVDVEFHDMTFTVIFEIADVRRGILSAAKMEDSGFAVNCG